MKHLKLLIAMALTCILAAIANVIVARMIGLNIFTFKLWFVVPIGAIAMGLLGASGAILAARYFHIRPNLVDAVLMSLVAAATMLLIYYLDYATFVLNDGRKASDLVDFGSYLDLVLTKTHMRVGRGARDAGEVGQMGYALAGLEFVGFLLGGAVTFFLIKGLPRCAACGSYLRKLRKRTTKELTFDEAGKVMESFGTGDLQAVQGAVTWAPSDRKLDPQCEKVLITFSLLGCSMCKTETVAASVNAFNGSEWKSVPSLTTRRNLPNGLSLRDQFV
jgi:hypothetical protein